MLVRAAKAAVAIASLAKTDLCMLLLHSGCRPESATLFPAIGALLLLSDAGKAFLGAFQIWRDRKRLAKFGESLVCITKIGPLRCRRTTENSFPITGLARTGRVA